VREKLESIKLFLGVDEEPVESLWVRIKGQTHMGDTVVGATGHLTRKRKVTRPSTSS